MRFSEWEPTYLEILSDLGFDRAEDEMCVRILKMATVNSDLIDDDEFSDCFSDTVTVFGNALKWTSSRTSWSPTSMGISDRRWMQALRGP